MRVQIPAYTDRWMRGDRFGEVIKVSRAKSGSHAGQDIASVKLDRSGKIVKVLYNDCSHTGAK